MQKKKGKSTGLVSTAELTDATPAAYAAHVTSRDDKNEIAKQFYKDKINGKHKVDVLLGGGAKYFGKSNGNLDKNSKMMVTTLPQTVRSYQNLIKIKFLVCLQIKICHLQ